MTPIDPQRLDLIAGGTAPDSNADFTGPRFDLPRIAPISLRPAPSPP
jgi:hypothetical protein